MSLLFWMPHDVAHTALNQEFDCFVKEGIPECMLAYNRLAIRHPAGKKSATARQQL
jgi:isocitrate lyase